MDDSLSVWQQPEIIRWSKILVNSYQQLLDKELINTANTPQALSQTLFHAPFVIVSHDTQADPIFNYGNQAALQLWSISWDELIKTPSRLSAEPENRATRSAMLEQAATKGYIANCQGVRISTTGQKFAIKQAIIWNLTDESGHKCGQAATFSDWQWLG
ncbi:MEKHLA domain-containing protein [Waterburya agarophytonicola K14]|uniref:MEKHLA domain-containing protein n=1 Tax=Waterburya agarophytonicola KI4 TaxID=2874699 RepID=A0A964FG66_9CYAN|nr:MEKHLA domain-containing protein [Waterburya agarophytonicola]MCC0177852.1 MEKHLA domain-containing protein [Waterburya agarophytonicola KI4]